MTNIAQSVNTVTVTNEMVDNAVGICYFDPLSESLIELSQLSEHYITVDPLQQIVRKYYIVVAPGEVVSYVRASVSEEGIEDMFSVKTIVGTSEPGVEAFSALPNFNSYTYPSPMAGDFISLWLLITSKTPLNEVLNIEINLEYE
jgi:hypothetical protein